MRLLALPGSIGFAHIGRLILIAQALRERGVEVTFGCATQHALLTGLGFPVHPVADVTSPGLGDHPFFAAFTPALIARCLADERRLIEQVQPDLLLGDLRPTLAITARLCRLPLVAVASGHYTDRFHIVDAMVDPVAHPLKHRLANAAAQLIQRRQREAAVAPLRAAAEQRGIRELRGLHQFLTGDLTLIADLPEYCPLHDPPTSFRYIGPLIWEGTEPPPAWLAELPEDPPLLYATIGNTGSERPLELLAEACGRNSGYQILITTGAARAPERLPRPPGARLHRFLPGSAVLRKAAVVLHCAGSGTVYQAIGQRVPAVAIPANADQRNSAWLLKHHRLGLPLSPQTATAAELWDALEQVRQDPTIRSNLARFAATPRFHEGPQIAAEEILRWRRPTV